MQIKSKASAIHRRTFVSMVIWWGKSVAPDLSRQTQVFNKSCSSSSERPLSRFVSGKVFHHNRTRFEVDFDRRLHRCPYHDCSHCARGSRSTVVACNASFSKASVGYFYDAEPWPVPLNQQELCFQRYLLCIIYILWYLCIRLNHRHLTSATNFQYSINVRCLVGWMWLLGWVTIKANAQRFQF